MNNAAGDSQTSRASRSAAELHLWEIVWVQDLGRLLLVGVGLAIVWWLRAIFQPVLLGLLFAYLLNPIIVWCQTRLNRSRTYCVCVLFASVVVAVIGLGALVLPLAISQVSDLASKMPDYVDALARRLGISDQTVLQKLREQGEAFMKDPVTNLSYLWDGVVTTVGVLGGVFGTATSLAMGVVLFPIYLFFFSWSWPSIAKWPDQFIPASRRARFREVLEKMDKAVGGYFRTRLLIALIMGVMYAVGWGVAGVPYWLLIGILAGLLGIIPYAASLAWVAAMLLCYLDLGEGVTGLAAALQVGVYPTIVFAIVQASDDWLLTPSLQGRELDMGFITIILAVLIGGAVAGLLGLLLAVPAAACVRIYWAEVLKPKLVAYAESQ